VPTPRSELEPIDGEVTLLERPAYPLEVGSFQHFRFLDSEAEFENWLELLGRIVFVSPDEIVVEVRGLTSRSGNMAVGDRILLTWL
jgi:hypothetical protein